jgi:hypothetical protein
MRRVALSLLAGVAAAATLCACAAENLAMAGDGDGESRATSAAIQTVPPAPPSPYQVDLLDDDGDVLPTFNHKGRVYVLGESGQRYQIRVRNNSHGRIEAVISVDGLDAIDGQDATWDKRGYIIGAGDELSLEGFRLSDADVASFRFSSVGGSYAAKTGDARNVGVIGVAIFRENPPAVTEIPIPEMPEPTPPKFPEDPEYEDEEPGTSDTPSAAGAGNAPSRSESQHGEATPSPPSTPPSGDALSTNGSTSTINPDNRPGLGTAFGEERSQPVVEVPFDRESPSRPDALWVMRYDDRSGLVALGIDVDHDDDDFEADRALRATALPFRNLSYAKPPAGWTPGDP